MLSMHIKATGGKKTETFAQSPLPVFSPSSIYVHACVCIHIKIQGGVYQPCIVEFLDTVCFKHIWIYKNIYKGT